MHLRADIEILPKVSAGGVRQHDLAAGRWRNTVPEYGCRLWFRNFDAAVCFGGPGGGFGGRGAGDGGSIWKAWLATKHETLIKHNPGQKFKNLIRQPYSGGILESYKSLTKSLRKLYIYTTLIRVL